MKSKLIFSIFISVFSIIPNCHSQDPWDIDNLQTYVNKSPSNTLGQFSTIEIRFAIRGWDNLTGTYCSEYPYQNYYQSFFDTTIIDCYGELITPSQKAIKIYGFLDKDPNKSTIECNSNLTGDNNPFNEQEEPIGYGENSAMWKFRITPNEVGIYYFNIIVKHRGYVKTKNGSFIVSPSNSPGFVQINETNSKYFNRQNEIGVFYPIGINNAWSSGYKDGPPNRTIGGFCYWKQLFDDLSNNGGNFVRIWLNMENTAVGFQPADLTLYDYNNWSNGIDHCNYWDFRFEYSLENAYRLDQIIEYAKSKNVYIQLSILQPKLELEWWPENFNTQQDLLSVWVDNNGVAPSNFYNIEACHTSPTKFVKHYGTGEINNPFEFYNSKGLNRQKYLIRYILARYSYATNVISWELGNELDYSIKPFPSNSSNYKFAFKNFPNPDFKNTVKTKDLSESDRNASETKHLERVNIWAKQMVKLIKYYDFHDHLVISGQRLDCSGTPLFYNNKGTLPNGTKHISAYGSDALMNSDFNTAHVYIKCPGLDNNPSSIDFGTSDMPDALYNYLTFDFLKLDNSKYKPSWIQEFDWGYELDCISLPEAIYLDPHGFYNHNVYWQSMVSGYAGLPLIWGHDIFKRRKLFYQLKAISNFLNTNLKDAKSDFETKTKTNNDVRLFYSVEKSTNRIKGWMQNNNFIFNRLITFNEKYLQSLDETDKPKINKTLEALIDVNTIGDYKVEWFSTVDGKIVESTTVRSNFNIQTNAIQLKLVMPLTLTENIYSDAAFILSPICQTIPSIDLEYGNNLENSIAASNLVQYSTNTSAVILNYGEDIILKLGKVHNKEEANFLFTEYSDGVATGNTYQLNNLQIGSTNEISLLEIFVNSFKSNGNPNTHKYFLTHSTKTISYKISINFTNQTTNCSSQASTFFYFKTYNCHTIAKFKINNSDQYNSIANALKLNYGEDFIIDATETTGETQFRISIVEIDENGNYLTTSEPYIDIFHRVEEKINFNDLYTKMNNKYPGNYLNPSKSSNSRYYKIKFVAMNAYTNQGCDLWEEKNLFIKIQNCSTVNVVKVNGYYHGSFTLTNPLTLNYGEDFNIDCRSTSGETQYRFSVIEVDNIGNYLWSNEPYISFTGNCNTDYSFNNLYLGMTNKPYGRYLSPATNGYRYYKIKYVSMNAYTDSGCTTWNEDNFFVRINSCHTTPELLVNKNKNSTFNNPITVEFGDKIIIDPLGSIGETQYRICIAPLDNNGNVTTSLEWPNEAYYHVNANCNQTFDLANLIPMMINAPTINNKPFNYFSKTHIYFKIKLVVMNAYNDEGCDIWTESNEYIKFIINSPSAQFDINDNQSKCIEITKECDPIILKNIKIGGGNEYKFQFEKLSECDNTCSNCKIKSDLQNNAYNSLNTTKLDCRDFEIDGFTVRKFANNTSNIDIRELYFKKFGTRRISEGYYLIRLKVYSGNEENNNNYLGNDVILKIINEVCLEPRKLESESDSNKNDPQLELTDQERIGAKDSVFVQKEKDFSVYPNPASIELIIKASNNIDSDNINVEFMNETGNLIFTSTFKLLDKETRIDLTSKQIPPGFYILNIHYDNKIEHVKVVIIS